MKILAIDTATEACSAALYIDGKIISEYQLAPREHTQLILPMVDSLLTEADLKINQLDALSYARGPGAFTGVRIAAGVIQGLSYANDIPVVPVSTLRAMAAGIYSIYGHEDILTAIDARMGEVYWGVYHIDQNQVQLVGEELVSSVESLPALEPNQWVGAGTGWSTYEDLFKEKYKLETSRIYPDYLPAAEFIVNLAAQDFAQGKQMSAHQAQPVYLRDNVAKKKKHQV